MPKYTEHIKTEIKNSQSACNVTKLPNLHINQIKENIKSKQLKPTKIKKINQIN